MTFVDHFSNNRWPSVYWLILGLVLIDRSMMLTEFHLKYVGSDDLIFWLGTVDYSKLIFHEPYFYGQNYNFMLEALFAAPFQRIGFPPNETLPIISSLLSLTPFVILSLFEYKSRRISTALFIISLPLLLPVEFSFLGSITRGFGTGIFVSSLFSIPFLARTKSIGAIVCLWLSVFFGYVMNPNSLVVTLPLLTLGIINNFNSIRFYISGFIVGSTCFAVEYFAKRFYEVNPEFKVCHMWKLEYNADLLIHGLENLDHIFQHFSILDWKHGSLAVILPFVIGLALIYKNEIRKGSSLLIGCLFVLVSLGFNKVNDDAGTILLSTSRMYLGMPLLYIYSFMWVRPILKIDDKLISTVISAVAMSLFLLRLEIVPIRLKSLVSEISEGPMPIANIQKLCQECETVKNYANKNNIKVVVVNPTWRTGVPKMEYYAYGCPVLIKDFPLTIMTSYEKRTNEFLSISESANSEYAILTSEAILGNAEYTNVRTSLVSELRILTIHNPEKLKLKELLGRQEINLKRK